MKSLQIASQFEILSDYITQPNCLLAAQFANGRDLFHL